MNRTDLVVENRERSRKNAGKNRRVAARLPVRPSALVALVVAIVTVISSGCDNAGADRILAIGATGTVVGRVYFDADADREPGPDDNDLSDVLVSLVNVGGTEPVLSATSDDEGILEIADVPVGRYQVVVDTGTIGDSAIVAHIDSAEITVLPADTQMVLIAVGFPLLNTSEVLSLPVGAKVFVDGVVLTGEPCPDIQRSTWQTHMGHCGPSEWVQVRCPRATVCG